MSDMVNVFEEVQAGRYKVVGVAGEGGGAKTREDLPDGEYLHTRRKISIIFSPQILWVWL